MNATPMQFNPVSAAPVQPASGKQQNSDTPDVPFSKVLSTEVAQKRNGGETRDDAQAQAESAQPAIDPAQAGTVAKAKPVDLDAFQVAPQDPLRVESPTEAPNALLALGLHPDQLKLAPTSMDGTTDAQADPALLNPDATTGQKARKGLPLIQQGANQPADDAQPDAVALSLDPQAAQKGRKGPMPLTAQGSGQHTQNAPGKQSAVDIPLDKPTLQAIKAASTVPNTQATVATTASATAAASATAFSAQLIAARQSEAMKFSDSLPDLMLDTATRTSPQALLDAATSMAGVASNKLAPSVGSTAWSQALGEKVVWMAAGAQQTASLTLNPPNMGPLQIVLNLSNDKATASFFSAQPEVRQALEAAFPRLREMMNEAGIQLGQASVSADTPRQHDTSNSKPQQAAPPFPGSPESIRGGETVMPIPVQRSGRGLVDTFA